MVGSTFGRANRHIKTHTESISTASAQAANTRKINGQSVIDASQKRKKAVTFPASRWHRGDYGGRLRAHNHADNTADPDTQNILSRATTKNNTEAGTSYPKVRHHRLTPPGDSGETIGSVAARTPISCTGDCAMTELLSTPRPNPLP